MYKKLLQKLNPIHIYYYLRHIQILQSPMVFWRDRTFLYSIFKQEYSRYKKWIEPAGQSLLPIDVVVPVIEKDLAVLPQVIKGIRSYIKHPIKKIYIVAPDVESIKRVADSSGCVFVNETDVCAITPQQINFVINGKNRSGWIYQQLLKLNLHKIGEARHVLVVDADTIFIRDTAFENNGRLYFDFSDEFTKTYYAAFEILTGMPHKSQVSFVSHYMLFDKQRLQELKAVISSIGNGTAAEQIIIDLKKKIVNNSYFSEYETYANYCVSIYPDQYRLRYWHNLSLPTSDISKLDRIVGEQKDKYQSVSFHSFDSKTDAQEIGKNN